MSDPVEEPAPWLSAFDIILLTTVAIVTLVFYLRNKFNQPVVNDFHPKPINISMTPVVQDEGGFVKKMKAGNRKVLILYGSQTGTAEGFANRLAKDAKRYGLGALVVDPEMIDAEELKEIAQMENHLAIFVIATYGEGDPTDNAQELNSWLKDAEPAEEPLKDLNFTVFALGNKTYENYNSVGIFYDKKVAELGGKRVFELGLGDDDANIEEDFISWSEKLWPIVCEQFNIDPSASDIDTRQFRSKVFEERPENVYSGEPARIRSFDFQKPPYDMKNPYLAPITEKRELHATDSDRSCMHIEFDISESKLRYEAGDHLAVYPQNNQQMVDDLISILGVDPEDVFSLDAIDDDAQKKHPFPCPTTWRTAFTFYVDIQSPPRTHVLRELAEYASDEGERTFLRLISSSAEEGKAKYSSWVTKDVRGTLQILQDLPSLRPPADHLIELLPRLQARYYSISSSPKMFPGKVHITAVLTDYVTPLGRKVLGVCTGFLAAKTVGDRLPIFIRRSTFRLPFRSSIPVIMIGPGTGLAPFRGFIQNRHLDKQSGKVMGDTALFFGCRKQDDDFIYREELVQYHADKTLTQFYTAFSRDQGEKVYVQHRLKEAGAEIWSMLEKRAQLYVCGDARYMAPDVQATVKHLVQTHGKMSAEDAAEYVKKMARQGRYSCDVWS